MHPGLGYVHSSRARATIHTYFKKQDKDKNLTAGKELLERELKRANVVLKDIDAACKRFNVNNIDDIYIAIGGGDIRLMQVVNYLQQLSTPPLIDPRIRQKKPQADKHKKDSIVVEGVGNLMNQIAGCCQPLPGEVIQGYITQGRGVSVHREDCDQLNHLLDQHPERQIDVNWASNVSAAFQTYIEVYSLDRQGILRDVTTVLANEKVGLLGVNSFSHTRHNSAKIRLTLEVKDLESLAKTISRLQQIRGVSDVVRMDN